MPIKHTVKAGETLWGLAQKYLGSGARWKEIQGYTGKPELLPAGTVLTVPTEAPTERATELKTQLGKVGEEAPGTEEFATALAGAGVGATAGAGKETAVTGITDFSKLWETEYTKSGLEDVKTKITGVDTDIATRKEQRDKMLLDEMGKPIPQWMITGRKKLEIDEATADLNRMIDQRNSLASQYNTGIGEVTRKTGYAIDYQKELAKSLREETEAERWEKGFGLEEKLYELQKTKAEAPNVRTSEYEVGGRRIRDTYDAETGELIKREDLGVATGEGAAKGFQVIKNIMGEPIGYFDPNTGESVYYKTEGGEGAGAPGPGVGGIQWFSESDIRTVVNEQLDQNLPADQIKTKFANIKASDTNKSVDEIIDEEQSKKTGGRGLGEWLKEEVWRRLPFVK